SAQAARSARTGPREAGEEPGATRAGRAGRAVFRGGAEARAGGAEAARHRGAREGAGEPHRAAPARDGNAGAEALRSARRQGAGEEAAREGGTGAPGREADRFEISRADGSGGRARGGAIARRRPRACARVRRLLRGDGAGGAKPARGRDAAGAAGNGGAAGAALSGVRARSRFGPARDEGSADRRAAAARRGERSEEHTSELQSPYDLVCRLLLEKKKKKNTKKTDMN